MPAEITAKTFFGTLASMTALLAGMMVYLIGGVNDRLDRVEARLGDRLDRSKNGSETGSRESKRDSTTSIKG